MKLGIMLAVLFSVGGLTQAQTAPLFLGPRTGDSLKYFQAAVFASPDTAFIMGDNGTFFRTRDGGRTWTDISLDSRQFFRSAVFPSARVGYAGGSGFFKTTDGGETWIGIEGFGFVADFHFRSPDSGIAARLHGGIASTTDGGMTWTEDFLNLKAQDMEFSDAANGWITGGGQDGNLYRSRDRGRTWTGQRLFSGYHYFQSVHFPSPRLGFLAGGMSTPIQMPDGSESYSISGVIARTSDGGETWTKMPVASRVALQDIHFLDARNGYAVGDSGTLLATADGGDSWQSLPTGTLDRLISIHAPGGATLYLQGSLGLYEFRVPVSVAGPAQSGRITSPLTRRVGLHPAWEIPGKTQLWDARGRIRKTPR